MNSNSEHDTFFMRRALELATLGQGMVAPNPMVGCVVVYNNQVIGEGWHRQYGQPHAEVNAIASVADKSLLSLSTVMLHSSLVVISEKHRLAPICLFTIK